MQVDRQTERKARLVIFHLYPDAPASYFVRSRDNPHEIAALATVRLSPTQAAPSGEMYALSCDVSLR